MSSISRSGRRDLAIGLAVLWAMLALPVWASVELTSFRAEISSQAVTIIWETQSELDNLGFNVYRAERATPIFSDLSADERVRINSGVIPSQGGVTAHTYSLSDTQVRPEVTYYYWLEDLDNQGGAGYHGPLRVALSGGEPVVLPTLNAVVTVTPTNTPPPVTAAPTSTTAPLTNTPQPTVAATALPIATPTLPAPTVRPTTPPTPFAPTAAPPLPTAPAGGDAPSPRTESTPLAELSLQPTAEAGSALAEIMPSPEAVAVAATPVTIGTDVANNLEATTADPDTPAATANPARGLLIAIGALALAALSIGGAALIYLVRRPRAE